MKNLYRWEISSEAFFKKTFIPKWYQCFSHFSFERFTVVYYIFPLHWAARFFLRLKKSFCWSLWKLVKWNVLVGPKKGYSIFGKFNKWVLSQITKK